MKKILVVILAALMSVSIAVSLVACGNKSDDSTSVSVSDSQSSENSTIPDSSSSSSEEKVAEVVKRTDAKTALAANVGSVTASNMVDFFKGSLSPVGMLLDGISIGDIVKYAGSEILSFDYYDDDCWRTGTGVKFGKVENAIFNYEIASQSPLDISQADLDLYGNTSIFNLYAQLFFPMMKPDALRQMLVQQLGTNTLLDFMLDTKVSDLYAITTGDYTYFGTITVNQIVNTIDAVTTIANDDETQTMLSPFATEILNGIKNLFGDVCINDFAIEAMATDIDEYVEICRAAVVAEMTNANTVAFIDVIFGDIKELANGPLSDIKFNYGADIVTIISHYLPNYITNEQIETFLNEVLGLYMGYLSGSDSLMSDLRAFVLKYTGINENYYDNVMTFVSMIGYAFSGDTVTVESVSAVFADYCKTTLEMTDEARNNLYEVFVAFGNNDKVKLAQYAADCADIDVYDFDASHFNGALFGFATYLGVLDYSPVIAFFNLKVSTIINEYTAVYTVIKDNGFDGLLEYLKTKVATDEINVRNLTLKDIDVDLNGAIYAALSANTDIDADYWYNTTFGELVDTVKIIELDALVFGGVITASGVSETFLNMTITEAIDYVNTAVMQFYAISDELLADLSVLTFAEVDVKYFNGSVGEILAAVDLQGLLAFTADDYMSLATEAPKAELTAELDKIKVVELVQKIMAMFLPQNPEIV